MTTVDSLTLMCTCLQVCGVLKTVRCMHRQRASENQSDHATKRTATAHDDATSE